jgi:isopenicillin N synthase-like dioxygenase
MTPHPTLDLATWHGSAAQRIHFLEQLDQACRSNGFFYVVNHGISPKLREAAMSKTRQFFDLNDADKNNIHIKQSAHFRGYSQMKNTRDWREQVHFGQELPASTLHRDCYQLQGNNQWPASLGTPFRDTMLAYLEAVQQVGQQLLSAMAELLQLPHDYFDKLSAGQPYLLMKLLCYYAQPNAEVDRPGVAAHCDWSWLTILLQDGVGGLEVLSSAGDWQAVSPTPAALSVNLGELLEILSGGQFVATAHRVINPSEEQRRLSIPVFINPALDAVITPVAALSETAHIVPGEHIHRVVPRGKTLAPFHFGDSEWARKGLGKWCHEAGCLKD